jgi:t-SNARE complex subunit (syntaxin)
LLHYIYIVVMAHKQEQMQLKQVQQQYSDGDFQAAIVKERDEEIGKLKNEMLGLNKLFEDVAGLIDVQGEQLNGIVTHVDETCKNLEEGNKELKEAEKSQESSNTLIAWIAGGITVSVGIISGAVAAFVLL